MPRQLKYDDGVYEKTEFSPKIFMYNSPEWNVLFPIVDIIRILKKNTLLGFMYGKGQQFIRTYGQQYNHRLLGYNLTNKKDYQELLKNKIKFIFIFNDGHDPVAQNLLKFSQKNDIVAVCFSNLDSCYHFHNIETVIKLKSAQETVENMYTLIDRISAKKFDDLFEDFELIEPEKIENTTLEECVNKLKQSTIDCQAKKDNQQVKLFDPHIAKIKAMEREREQRKEALLMESSSKSPNILSRFFKTPAKKINNDMLIKQ